MKRNDITALHEKTTAQLQTQLEELKLELAKVSLELPVGKLNDVRKPGKIKDDIARIKTVLSLQKLATFKDNKDNKDSKDAKEAVASKENK